MPSVAAKLALERAKTRKPDNSKSLECLLCFERYGYADIKSGAYRIETMICSNCYRKMQLAPHKVSCFGKPSVAEKAGDDAAVIAARGYDPNAEECLRLCPDREVCGKLFQKSIVSIEESYGEDA